MVTNSKKGFIFDNFGYLLVLIILLLGVYTWFTLSNSLQSILADPDSNAVKLKVDGSLFTFDAFLPYLFGLMVVGSITAFAILPVSRMVVFIAAAFLLIGGLFMQFFEPAFALIVSMTAVPLPNIMWLVGQIKPLMFVGGLVMLIVGYMKGER